MQNKNQIARHLLSQNSKTAEDFDAFCLDHFPKCKARFTSDMDRLHRENLLLELEGPDNVISALRGESPQGKKLSNRTIFLALAMIIFLVPIFITFYSAAGHYIASNINNTSRLQDAFVPGEQGPHEDVTKITGNTIINTGTISTKGSSSPINISNNNKTRNTIINNGKIRTSGNNSRIAIGGDSNEE